VPDASSVPLAKRRATIPNICECKQGMSKTSSNIALREAVDKTCAGRATTERPAA
jgi:hypothetical protein